jgi:hypothetical protein
VGNLFVFPRISESISNEEKSAKFLRILPKRLSKFSIKNPKLQQIVPFQNSLWKNP